LAQLAIEFSQVVKDYGRKVIGPLDLFVERGKIVGFLGPNGSGKTTSIRLILGLVKPTSGSVKVNGLNPISNHVEALRDVGYSPELPNIQSFITPEELLLLTGRMLRLSGDLRPEIARVLELAGLLEYRRVKVGKMSKGMVQRLSIAQAVIGSPRILILDEPMIGLDPLGTAHLRDVFRKFARETSGTVFLSSHMMNEVENLCDSVAMIHSGKIITNGTIYESIRKIMGFSAVEVLAEGVTQSTIERLRGIEGVTTVKFDGTRSIEIELARASESEENDLRPVISRLLVESGAKLYVIKPAENLLERAYIRALASNADAS
jgi:ABC-2 type transport system ATP-binding protein